MAPLAACSGAADSASVAPYRPAPKYAERISKPAAAPRVTTDRVDALGRAVTIGCPTCHSLSATPTGFGRPDHVAGEAMTHFHQGLTVTHGALACRACHEGPNYAALHLADGKTVAFTDVQALCSQCHGPQARDYAHGTHGGMNGYWDLSRGPRERHHCTVCHDPHVPAYVGMMPARGPVDPHPGGH